MPLEAKKVMVRAENYLPGGLMYISVFQENIQVGFSITSKFTFQLDIE